MSMVVKADIVTVQAENSEFPQVCEGCLGENPYLRMQKIPYGGTCKMCDRAFTMFRWRPGRGEGNRKTEVCQTCARLKNICQTCILDLQFGLPSQLRDTVLAEVGSMPLPESDVGKEFLQRKQMMMLENGDDPWQDQMNPNEKLLELARSAVENREQSRVKLPGFGAKRTHQDAFEEKQVAESLIKAKREDVSLLITKTEDFSLPPGVSDVTMLNQLSQRVVNFISGEGNSNTNVSDSATSKGIDDSKSNNDHKVATTQATKKPLPPKPPGPPPAWAFKNNPQAVIDGKNMSKV